MCSARVRNRSHYFVKYRLPVSCKCVHFLCFFKLSLSDYFQNIYLVTYQRQSVYHFLCTARDLVGPHRIFDKLSTYQKWDCGALLSLQYPFDSCYHQSIFNLSFFYFSDNFKYFIQNYSFPHLLTTLNKLRNQL